MLYKSAFRPCFVNFVVILGIFLSYHPYSLAQAIYSNPYTISTLAGSAYNNGTSDGLGVNAQFNNPYGVAVDNSGNLYVADSKNYIIRKITPSGLVTTIAGQAGLIGNVNGTGLSAQFGVIEGIAIDSSGNLYVTDLTYNTVRKVTQTNGNWTVSTVIPSTAGLNQPIGIAVDTNGNLYIADSGNYVIRKVSVSGTMTILAGSIGQSSGINGVGTSATFAGPVGVAVDNSGNIYVTDSGASTIRKISSSGVVTTIGGFIGAPGLIDGPLNNTENQFSHPFAIAIDSAGNLFISDQSSLTVIREITSNGIVSTIAGAANIAASNNGTGSQAYFNNPHGIAVDSLGNLYIADSGSSIIRKGVSANAVPQPPTITSSTTAGGIVGSTFTYTIAATNNPTIFTIGGALPAGLSFNSATGVISGTPVAAGSNTVSLSATNPIGTSTIQLSITINVLPPPAPVINTQPVSQSVKLGSGFTLSVNASSTISPVSYQWYFNNTAIAGATNSTYTVTSASTLSSGSYTVTVTNNSGSTTSTAAQVSVIIPGYLTDLSVLAMDGPGNQLLTIGFTNGGAGTSGAQNLLIRGAGPALAAFNIQNYLPDPVISVFQGSSQIAFNDNWGNTTSNITSINSAEAATGAFPYTSTISLDAALVQSLPSVQNGYTVQISGKNNSTGLTIAEVYDYTPDHAISSPRLTNLSTLLLIPANSYATAGFVIGGTTPVQILIRASGPTLATLAPNISNTLADPMLKVYSGNLVIASNTGWAGNPSISVANTASGAFQFNSNSKDSAVVTTLNPGSYTVQASSASGAAGVTLIELYEVPNSN